MNMKLGNLGIGHLHATVMAGLIAVVGIFPSLSHHAIAAPSCNSPDARSSNEVWVSNSWDLFNARRYAEAVANVDACLHLWSATAEKLQRDHDSKSSGCPAVGGVNVEVRRLILANGPLNDVATSYWIKARSLQELGNDDQAKTAFESCAKLKCARTWDERGWFWNPAQDCSVRIRSLR